MVSEFIQFNVPKKPNHKFVVHIATYPFRKMPRQRHDTKLCKSDIHEEKLEVTEQRPKSKLCVTKVVNPKDNKNPELKQYTAT